MNILIAEDEPQFSTLLSDYLQRFARENELSVYIEVFQNGAEMMDKYRPKWDLLLLDVDMPGMDGFTVAEGIRKVDPDVAIIFITNLAQYAIRGYKVHALDYILKPVSYPALSMKLKREMNRIIRREDRTIMIYQNREVVRIPVSKLCYVEIYGHSMRYHTTNEVLENTGAKTLSSLEKELKNDGFFRCHSGFLINMKYVDAVGENAVKVMGQTIPVSRSRKKGLIAVLMNRVRG